MNYPITRLYAVVLTVVVIVALAAGYAAGQGVAGQAPPFVVDIAQDVPFAVDAPVQLDSGDTVTVTVPLTVGVELRIRVDGPQASVETLPASEPVISVAPETGLEAVAGVVQMRLLSAEDIGQTLDGEPTYHEDKTTLGRFILLQAEIENLGTRPVSFAGIDLIDDRGRTFDQLEGGHWYVAEEKQCLDYDQLNPGVPRLCTQYFEVPENASGLSAYIRSDGGEEAAIDLGL